MRVTADASYAVAAFIFTGVRFGVVLAVALVAMIASGEMEPVGAVAGTLTFWVVLTFATGLPMTLWWLLRPGRVSYEVAEGELRVYRGSKVVRRHPCADITFLRLGGGLDWSELTYRNWFTYGIDGWPQLYVDRREWPRPRALVGPRRQPASLLWGKERCADLQAELRGAVAAHGAILREDA